MGSLPAAPERGKRNTVTGDRENDGQAIAWRHLVTTHPSLLTILVTRHSWPYTSLMSARHLTPFDDLISAADRAVKTVLGGTSFAQRPNPADSIDHELEDAADKARAARLMRVNHSGEVAAQALYQGQALTARLDQVREAMNQAAEEENDHLVWCAERIRELGSQTSLLNPLWYLGSFAIGAAAGAIGDRWSLGFVAETEKQVVRHLESHLEHLPVSDEKSRVILEQMKDDEARHGTTAMAAGAVELPELVRKLMTMASRVMTRTAYWL